MKRLFFNSRGHFMSRRTGRFGGSRVISFLLSGNVTLCSATATMHHLRSGTSSGFLRIIAPASVSRLLGGVPRYATVIAAKRGTASALYTAFSVRRPSVNAFAPFGFNSHELQLCHVPSASHTCPVGLRGGTRFCHVVFRRLRVVWGSCANRRVGPG